MGGWVEGPRSAVVNAKLLATLILLFSLCFVSLLSLPCAAGRVLCCSFTCTAVSELLRWSFVLALSTRWLLPTKHPPFL